MRAGKSSVRDSSVVTTSDGNSSTGDGMTGEIFRERIEFKAIAEKSHTRVRRSTWVRLAFVFTLCQQAHSRAM